ncbi:hypothetical protein BABINDRAFT_176438 [Babjeviella inositovora NRRL Y-12698]|uniref:Shr3 amino acid permease chaperone n=1 Tax=Babjeviella inositovora NRRL Y-12698 TaxID=984486 RepID=A0A1E3QPD2_9ASCO|nr:uncharacterized protein BABINDRAFT_176438 [Babjeviella inositovora NRRL Y-12698]ODQ79545.1 hypothetical protein BABINDRAFT_176438 [Babjeviella inositovora NRRL Y-12698]
MSFYEVIIPPANAVVVGSTCFALGAIYGNLPYDFQTLWSGTYSDEAVARSVAHYALWGNSPNFVHYILHGVMALGFLGMFVKLYKPNPDAKMFEYGTLGLYMAGVIFYLTNMRIGVQSAIVGEWGDVDERTGINVIAASEVFIVFIYVGILVLQGGLYYAQWEDAKLKAKFYADEAALEAQQKAAQGEVETVEEVDATTSSSAKASGSKATKKSKAKN